MNLFRHYFGNLFRSLRWGAEAGVAFAILTASVPAFADIAKPADIIAGHTQLEWAQAWWQWAVGIPAPNNPLSDTTGANAGVNNNGPVFFVAGVLGSSTVARTFTVPSGKPIFVPVVNGVYAPIGPDGNYNPDPCTGQPPQFSCAIQTATAQFSPLNSMSLQIDGVSLNTQELRSYRQTSTSYFTANLPGNNIFGIPAAKSNYWAQDGYYVTLTNLSPGPHLLVFSARWKGNQLNVTDKINIVP
jgi:hypothetical protein